MMTPTFIAVSTSGACTLADLTVTGYDAPVYDSDMEETTGGCVGLTFGVQFLNNNGTTKKSYYWIDDGNGHKGWYADGSATEIDGGASSVSIPVGASLWISGKGLKLVSAGQVNTSDIVYQTSESGAVAIGSGTPVDLTLNQLVVTGYDDPIYDADMEETTGGCTGLNFCVQFLNGNGTTKASYYWIDDGNGHKGWYADGSATEIDGGASSVSIPSGQGLWVSGHGLYLRIPAPEM